MSAGVLERRGPKVKMAIAHASVLASAVIR